MRTYPYHYWCIETQPTREESYIFEKDEVWPEVPPCPLCEQPIDRAYKEYALVREWVSDIEFVTSDGEVTFVGPDDYSITEYRTNIGVVEPCGHKFQNPTVLHDYVIGHKFGMGSIRGRDIASQELVNNSLW